MKNERKESADKKTDMGNKFEMEQVKGEIRMLVIFGGNSLRYKSPIFKLNELFRSA